MTADIAAFKADGGKKKFDGKPGKQQVIDIELDITGKDLSSRDREQLVLEFRMKARKLARSILRKWHARLDLQEVDSVVDLSLCEAVKRFNPDKGASFMTFLFYHLRGNLIRAVSTAASQSTVRSADIEEEEGRRFGGKSVNAMEVAEALCGGEASQPDELLFRKQLINISAEACSQLDELEQEVIYRIYMKEQQLMDIANNLGYSRCHISRVKKKALETLYHSLTARMHTEDEIKKQRKYGMSADRRRVHRRRPRSRKAIELRSSVSSKAVA